MTSIMKRKWKTFFSQKKAIAGLIVFIIILLAAIFANFISNNKPILLIRSDINNENHKLNIFSSKLYFPVLINYQPQDFHILDSFIIDYKILEDNDKKNNIKTYSIYPWNKWDAEEQSDSNLSPPSATHWLGTDNLGRDIFARLIYGVRISLGFSIILWIISYILGAFIGALQGYFFGIFDFILERFKELIAIIPMLTLVILVTAITKSQSFWIILFLVLIFGWMGIASQIRANVLSIRKREFCEASIALGGSHLRVLAKHILPNSLTPLITLSPFAIEGGVSLLAALDYLGFGLPPPTPSLGELMSQGRDNIQNAPWLLISPVVTILLILISVSLIGQALRKTFDPKVNE
ncbi:ABC transporter permease subunit [Silvanigrella sp.]|jgi:microcin C transport system permease protein|uniref:ABC transporter permease subunit n=1 Tax=Silvanigrella sp. TaxID=2024976 RepID=UPI0037C89016